MNTVTQILKGMQRLPIMLVRLAGMRRLLIIFAVLATPAAAQTVIPLDASTSAYDAVPGDVAVFRESHGIDATLWHDAAFRARYAAAHDARAKAEVVMQAYDRLYAEHQSLTIDEAIERDAQGLFIPSRSKAPNMGFQTNVVWYKVQLHYTGAEARTFLMLADGFVRDMQIFVVQGRRVLQSARTGSFYHPEVRPLVDWGSDFGAPITVPPNMGPITVYFKTHSDGTTNSFNFRIATESSYNLSKKIWYLAQGIYFGSTAGLLIYNLFIFCVSGQPAYILYVLFLASMINVFMVLHNFSIIMPDYFGGIYVTPYFMFSLYGSWATFMFFVSRFMAIKRQIPWLDLCLKALAGLAVSLFVLHFFLAPETATIIGSVYSLAGIVAIAGTAAVMMAKKERNAFFFVGAFSFLIAGLMVYTLYTMAYLPRSVWSENSFQIGSFLDSLLLSVALGDKLRTLTLNLHTANAQLRQYIGQVEVMVEQKTRHIRTVMTHIKQGIFGILPGGTIHEDYSLYLEDIIGKGQLQGRNAVEVFLQDSNLSADDLSRIRLAIDSALDSPIGFELNSSHFPQEVEYAGKILELDWQLISNEKRDLTEKLLVVVRDVTHLRELEQDGRHQKQEMSRIMEVMNVPPSRFLEFLGQCRRFLQTHTLPVPGNHPDIRATFIQYHTLKGLARSLEFKGIVDLLHEAETLCLEIQNGLRTYQRHELQAYHDRLESMLRDYEQISSEKLGRRIHDEVRLDRMLIKSGIDMLEALPQKEREQVLPLRRAFYENYYLSLDHFFQDVFASVPLLAQDLHKEVPRIQWPPLPFYLKPEGGELLRNVLVHLLRNAMDHGLEPAEERLAQGKPAMGTLSITAAERPEGLELIFADDGRGLHLERLKALGVQEQLIDASCQDPIRIAQLVFHSGLSTAVMTTDVSGRGVGMDAARSFLQTAGGSLEILIPDQQTYQVFIPISFRLLIPAHLFQSLAWDAAI